MRGGTSNHGGAARAAGVSLRVANTSSMSRRRRALIAALQPRGEPRAMTEPAHVQELAPVGGASKRALDIVIALLVLILLAPLMALIAVGIRLCMGGPVIFRHERIGLNG